MLAAAIAIDAFSGCARFSAPQIAEGLDPQSGAFEHRVRATFPAGTDGAELASALAAQGFVIGTDTAGKPYAFHDNWCSGWSVDWSLDRNGRVARIDAQEPRCAGP